MGFSHSVRVQRSDIQVGKQSLFNKYLLPAVQHEAAPAELEKDEVPCGRRRLSRLHPDTPSTSPNLSLTAMRRGGKKKLYKKSFDLFFFA